MTPVVNPWIFYFANLADSIRSFLILGVAFICVAVIFIGVLSDEDSFEETYKLIKKIVFIGIAMFVLYTIFPSSATIYAMLIAKTTTPENVTSVYEAILNAARVIIQTIDG